MIAECIDPFGRDKARSYRVTPMAVGMTERIEADAIARPFGHHASFLFQQLPEGCRRSGILRKFEGQSDDGDGGKLIVWRLGVVKMADIVR